MQKSRRVSLTPASFLLSWLKFFFLFFSKRKPQLLTPPIQFAYVDLHPPQMSYIASLEFLAILGSRFFSVSDVFWCILGDASSARSWNTPDQGAGNTGNRCLLFRLVQTHSDFRPMGFCLTEVLYVLNPSALLNNAPKHLKIESSCKYSNRRNNVTRLKMPSMTPQQKAGICFKLILPAKTCSDNNIWRWLFTLSLAVALPSPFECSKPDV